MWRNKNVFHHFFFFFFTTHRGWRLSRIVDDWLWARGYLLPPTIRRIDSWMIASRYPFLRPSSWSVRLLRVSVGISIFFPIIVSSMSSRGDLAEGVGDPLKVSLLFAWAEITHGVSRFADGHLRFYRSYSKFAVKPFVRVCVLFSSKGTSNNKTNMMWW